MSDHFSWEGFILTPVHRVHLLSNTAGLGQWRWIQNLKATYIFCILFKSGFVCVLLDISPSLEETIHLTRSENKYVCAGQSQFEVYFTAAWGALFAFQRQIKSKGTGEAQVKKLWPDWVSEQLIICNCIHHCFEFKWYWILFIGFLLN